MCAHGSPLFVLLFLLPVSALLFYVCRWVYAFVFECGVGVYEFLYDFADLCVTQAGGRL
jgi:hypothetical protein